ncbi:hypothetical protein ACCD06_27725 [Azospirillum sp. CT11-132]|jgi:hypothetical protein|uniref:hypothetical protein n=1 Tax=unclassified Azospirillum TaxID=2630922 RepID=UPI000D61BCE1|nr:MULTISPECIES: hypothetical protein [unclassified Azospirillum]PWC65286.1 hypothetical protein TSH7_08920 [Azospirillum sp. TSH7]PWC71797.1 hypothetical protein TSH20_03050 [Azospirillum sp. TSH20]
MTAPIAAPIAKDVLASATLHLDVLEEFIAVVRRRMASATDSFARDSLNDLLLSLTEQRDSYQAFLPLAAAEPV